MRRASSAASSVPKSNGHTKATKLEAPYSASGGAVKAGTPSTGRKTAAPASASRISRPAALVVPAKTRSPGRCLARLVDAVTCADTGIGSPLGTGRADEGEAPVGSTMRCASGRGADLVGDCDDARAQR